MDKVQLDHFEPKVLDPHPPPTKAPDLHLTTTDLANHGDKFALNPQPLPPKVLAHEGKSDISNHLVTVTLHGADLHYPAGLGHTDMKHEEPLHISGHEILAHGFTHHDTGHHGD